MAVQIPLNHFVTDLHRPGQTPLEVLQGNITSHKLKSYAFQAIEKISYVALLAIVATVFAVSYNFIVLTGVAPLVMAGLILATPILVLAPIKLAQLGRQHFTLAEVENRAALKLREIEQWSAPDIDQFFMQNEIDITRVNLNALRQIHPQEPKKALLPLIARYQSMREQIAETKEKGRAETAALEAGFIRNEANGQQIPNRDKQKIRFENQCMNWNHMELNAIPTALNAATLLYLIENPTTTDVDILPLSFEISGVGTCEPRNYPERMFGKNNNPQNDDYFAFYPALNRPAITHAEIENLQLNPYLLKQKLFPGAQ